MVCGRTWNTHICVPIVVEENATVALDGGDSRAGWCEPDDGRAQFAPEYTALRGEIS